MLRNIFLAALVFGSSSAAKSFLRADAEKSFFELHKDSYYKNPANQKKYDNSIKDFYGKDGVTELPSDPKSGFKTAEVLKSLQTMQAQPSAYWIDTISKIGSADSVHDTDTMYGILADAAAKPTPEMVVLIHYDLPNRDCNALASNGEICCGEWKDGVCDRSGSSGSNTCEAGLETYKSKYVDAFAGALAKYPKVPVVVVFEPDSLPNLVTGKTNNCTNKATKTAYMKGTEYALNKLFALTNVQVYLDAGHGGWLGWNDNLAGFMKTLKEIETESKIPGFWKKVRGFATNVSNYQPVGRMCDLTFKPQYPGDTQNPFRSKYCPLGANDATPGATPTAKTDECCSDPCKLRPQYNPCNNELNYAAHLRYAAKTVLGWEPSMVIDTSRNGVPKARSDCETWCNPRDAGAGLLPGVEKVADVPEVDAFFWLKTPGESDGCTEYFPDENDAYKISQKKCKRFDPHCQTVTGDTMKPNVDSIGSSPQDVRAPEAGSWFDYQVKMLAANANFKGDAVIKPSKPNKPDQPGGDQPGKPDQPGPSVPGGKDWFCSWNPCEDGPQIPSGDWNNQDKANCTRSGGKICEVAQPTPVKPEPVKPEPVKPEPVKPEPVKPEPVKPEHAAADTFADCACSATCKNSTDACIPLPAPNAGAEIALCMPVHTK